MDYVEGNRVSPSTAKVRMLQGRYFGSNVLTLLTKVALGYWPIFDLQTGLQQYPIEHLA